MLGRSIATLRVSHRLIGAIVNREELAALAQKLGTPVDFDGLVKSGVLRKAGKGKSLRYAILDNDRLPEYASRQINEIVLNNVGEVPIATFASPTSNKSAQIVYEKVTGKKFMPLNPGS